MDSKGSEVARTRKPTGSKTRTHPSSIRRRAFGRSSRVLILVFVIRCIRWSFLTSLRDLCPLRKSHWGFCCQKPHKQCVNHPWRLSNCSWGTVDTSSVRKRSRRISRLEVDRNDGEPNEPCAPSHHRPFSISPLPFTHDPIAPSHTGGNIAEGNVLLAVFPFRLAEMLHGERIQPVPSEPVPNFP